jgi:hypothetical protein
VLFALPVLVLLGLGVRTVHAPGLREDEVVCEDALARIKECCGNSYSSNISCVYVDDGDCSVTYPSLSVSEGDMVRQQSCDAIIAEGYCTRSFDNSPDSSGGEY